MKLTQIIASATVAAVLGTAGVSVASASSSSTPSPSVSASASANAAPKTGHVKGKRARRFVRKAVALVAKTIGIQPADLVAELRAGKTIAGVANEHSVAPQTVIDALVKAATAKIEAAQAAGKITDARAAKLEQRLPTLVARVVNDWHPRGGGGRRAGGGAGASARASVTGV